jgi:hypothetical protein
MSCSDITYGVAEISLACRDQFRENVIPARERLQFNKSGFVESLNLYSNNEKSQGWGPIADVYNGNSEDEVLKLGQPTRQNLKGVSKTIEYRDIGIVVTLTKGRAYMFTIKGPQDKSAVLRRFLRTVP